MGRRGKPEVVDSKWGMAKGLHEIFRTFVRLKFCFFIIRCIMNAWLRPAIQNEPILKQRSTELDQMQAEKNDLSKHWNLPELNMRMT